MFSSLVTPTDIPRQWTAAVDRERVPQAVLLSGAAGSELLPLSLKLVGYAQCSDRRLDVETGFGESCGACEACRSHARLTHPDVHFTFPVVGTGNTSADLLPRWREEVLANPYLGQGAWLRAQTADNKQGNINRDEVMRILHDVSLQRFTSGYKVVLVWGADYLGDEANRLLKVIEEPPERTLIVLVTERLERILPTIVSRCRVYRVPPPPAEGIARLLTERGVAPARATELAYASGGDIGLAVASAEDDADEGGGGAPGIVDWLRACFTGSGVAITQSAARLSKLTREQQKHFLQQALRFVRELGVARAGEPLPLRLSPRDREVAVKLSALTDWPQLAALGEELDALLTSVERNANPKIAFTAAAVRIHRILAPQRAPVALA